MTLFELLVVLAIIALLATLVAPRVVGYLGRAKSDIAVSQLSSLVSSLELYAIDQGGEYPSAELGLRALVEAPVGVDTWTGPYLRDVDGLIDPWDRPYLYRLNQDNTQFVVFTLGKDGVEGGEGENRDLEKR